MSKTNKAIEEYAKKIKLLEEELAEEKAKSDYLRKSRDCWLDDAKMAQHDLKEADEMLEWCVEHGVRKRGDKLSVLVDGSMTEFNLANGNWNFVVNRLMEEG